jgi:hypothetical protein
MLASKISSEPSAAVVLAAYETSQARFDGGQQQPASTKGVSAIA